MQLLRPGSFLDRLKNNLLGRAPSADYGYLPPSMQTVFQREYGLPPTFKTEESQQAYADNPWLYSAVNVIAHEVARTNFRLITRNKKGEEKPVESHQAL